MNLTLPIALDAMGGDNAPHSVIEGAKIAIARHPGLRFIFFGDAAKIESLIAASPALAACSELVHTDVAIASDAKPSVALRQGKQSSMRLGIDAVRDGKASGVVSAGNTGALMATAKVILKTLPGIYRPAIATLLPTMRSSSVVLDLGANVECTSEDLFQFAVMGDAFAKAVLGIASPSIGILNVGSEEMKGHEEVRAASQLLKTTALPLNFVGFIEGDDIAKGTVDVVVTDGFSGNIALKTAEGTAAMISSFMRKAFKSSVLSKIGYLLASAALAKVKAALDPRNHNGAMFIGLNGVVVKSHGSADAVSFAHAIHVAVELAANQINAKIIEEIRQSGHSVTAVAEETSEAAL